MRETVLSGFEQRWGPWAGARVETRFKIKGLGWWSYGDCWGIERNSDLEWYIGWVCCIAGGKGREELEVVWPWTLTFSACGVLIGSKSERQSGKHTVSRWEAEFIGMVSAWRLHGRGEQSCQRGENRKVKRQEWNVTCDTLLGDILSSLLVHCNILANESVKYH